MYYYYYYHCYFPSPSFLPLFSSSFTLSFTGIVGEVHEKTDDGAANPDYFMFTHKKLDIGYNGDQIVDVNLTSEFKTKISIGSNITFTYEVRVLEKALWMLFLWDKSYS